MTSANDKAVLNAIFNPVFGDIDDEQIVSSENGQPGAFNIYFRNTSSCEVNASYDVGSILSIVLSYSRND